MTASHVSLAEAIPIAAIVSLRQSSSTSRFSVWTFVRTELLSRIVALSLSVFAAIDSLYHVLVGAAKLYLTATCIRRYSMNEINDHFAISYWFAKTALLGSLVCSLFPVTAPEFRYQSRKPSTPPPPPPPNRRNRSRPVAHSTTYTPPPPSAYNWTPAPATPAVYSIYHQPRPAATAIRITDLDHLPLERVGEPPLTATTIAARYPNAPDALIQPASDVITGAIRAPFQRLKNLWARLDLAAKNWFIRIFNHPTTDAFTAVRQELGPTVYKIFGRSLAERARWLAPHEEDARFANVWRRAHGEATHPPVYFHATQIEGFRGILRSRNIEVRQDSAFRGAFVSGKPEISYGSYIFAFNRTIERMSPPIKHLSNDRHPWIGFGAPIPISQTSLSCIIIIESGWITCNTVQAECRALTGWDIPVISLDTFLRWNALSSGANRGMNVPIEWEYC